MEDNSQIQKYLQDYIQTNRTNYTRRAIEHKLSQAGYSSGDIDDAFEALGLGWWGEETADKSKRAAEPGDWRSAAANPWGFLLFFPVLPILGYVLAVMSDGNLLGLVYIGTVIAGFYLPMWVKHQNPGLAKGMIYGFRVFLAVFVCFPVVAVAVLWGICMVSGGFNI
jgi:hypothetical protein